MTQHFPRRVPENPTIVQNSISMGTPSQPVLDRAFGRERNPAPAICAMRKKDVIHIPNPSFFSPTGSASILAIEPDIVETDDLFEPSDILEFTE